MSKAGEFRGNPDGESQEMMPTKEDHDMKKSITPKPAKPPKGVRVASGDNGPRPPRPPKPSDG